jgi:hypothetical protein|tara:strand:- start:1667 stop:1945 length:279 start_codon:yes stop_codon:yes gene_type:complete
MLTDYKISLIRRSATLNLMVVRFYEGDITTEREMDPATGIVGPVTRYRRTRLLREEDFAIDVDQTDEEIRRTLNGILATSATHDPIREQVNG